MTGPDRLVLDLLWLRPGRVGGTETYVVSLLDALAAAGHRLDVVVTSPLLAAHPHLAEQHSAVRERRFTSSRTRPTLSG